jgi:hypothetical protein
MTEFPYVLGNQSDLLFRVLFGISGIRFDRLSGHALDRQAGDLFV